MRLVEPLEPRNCVLGPRQIDSVGTARLLGQKVCSLLNMHVYFGEHDVCRTGPQALSG